MEPNQKPEFDVYKDDYSSRIDESLSFAGQSHDFYTKVKAEHLLGVMREKHEQGEPVDVLDVGCGHGLIHPYLLNQNHNPINLQGVDVAGEVIEEAKKANKDVAYQSYDGQRLPFEDNSFDVVFTICVMHHVPPEEWTNFVKEMKRVLKPGGILLVYEHNPYNPVTVHIVNTCPLDENAVLLKPKVLKHHMAEAGLNIPKITFILFFPVDHKVFRMVENCLTKLPLGAQYVMQATKGA